MYRGRVVERGPADDVILHPKHPYTQLLASAAPNPERRGRSHLAVSGSIEPASAGPAVPRAASGCNFRDRCAFAMDACAQVPPDFAVGDDHLAKCWLYPDGAATPAVVQGRPA